MHLAEESCVTNIVNRLLISLLLSSVMLVKVTFRAYLYSTSNCYLQFRTLSSHPGSWCGALGPCGLHSEMQPPRRDVIKVSSFEACYIEFLQSAELKRRAPNDGLIFSFELRASSP